MFETRLSQLVFSLRQGNYLALLGGVRLECSFGRALTIVRPWARPTPLKCKNDYPVLALGEETAVQAVVGSIVWAYRTLKKLGD